VTVILRGTLVPKYCRSAIISSELKVALGHWRRYLPNSGATRLIEGDGDGDGDPFKVQAKHQA
jgi:hypothetical protein